MDPKVSVIIPCYNYDKYIEQCIMSVLLQRVDFKIEIIIGDDNSTDNSYAIANRLKSFYETDNVAFNIIKQEINIGEIDNTKCLLENAKGEYIAYLDADDFWINPYKLKAQVDFMDSNPDYSMCVAGYIILENNNYIPINDFSLWLRPVDINNLSSESLVPGNSVGTSSSRFFRNYDNIVQSYFYEFPYSDWPMNFELSLRGKIGYINFPSYVYRVHEKSLSKNNTLIDVDHQIIYEKRVGILRDILNKKLYTVSDV